VVVDVFSVGVVRDSRLIVDWEVSRLGVVLDRVGRMGCVVRN
jgi:hypothetical protein